jgi:hypothetical protein
VEEAWKVAANAKGIRPAKPGDVIKWLKEYRGDAKFAESCQVGSKAMNREKPRKTQKIHEKTEAEPVPFESWLERVLLLGSRIKHSHHRNVIQPLSNTLST